MTLETMNMALADVAACWSLGASVGPCLVDASHASASESARNHSTLSQYVAIAERKGKTEAEMATAIRAKLDGDSGPYDAILAGAEA